MRHAALTRRLAVAAMAAALSAGPVAARATSAGASCAASGGLRYVCGVAAVEDLVPVAGGRFLVGSSYKPGSVGLYRIDTVGRTARPVKLTVAARRDPRFRNCPGPILGSLQTHGLAAVAEGSGGATIYAVNHGGRESVEVFRLDPAANEGAWIGCVVLPPGASGNSVVALSGGRLAVSRFEDAGDPKALEKIFGGAVTGLVYLWTPGAGFTEVPGSRLSGDNGLEASRDGKWLFVNEYGRKRIWRLPLGGEAPPASVAVPFHPDNLRWASDGTLLATGQFVRPGRLAELHDWATVRLDPRTMRVAPLFREAARPEFDSATTAVEAGGVLWFGSFRGDRIAYRSATRSAGR